MFWEKPTSLSRLYKPYDELLLVEWIILVLSLLQCTPARSWLDTKVENLKFQELRSNRLESLNCGYANCGYICGYVLSSVLFCFFPFLTVFNVTNLVVSYLFGFFFLICPFRISFPQNLIFFCFFLILPFRFILFLWSKTVVTFPIFLCHIIIGCFSICHLLK